MGVEVTVGVAARVNGFLVYKFLLVFVRFLAASHIFSISLVRTFQSTLFASPINQKQKEGKKGRKYRIQGLAY